MNSSLPACAPDRTSRGDHLLRAFGFVLRKSWWMWGSGFALSVWKPTQYEYDPLWVALMFFGATCAPAAEFAKIAPRCLPLGKRRTSLFLWWCRVPLTPLMALFCGVCRGLWHAAPAFGNYAQRALWAAGFLALMSLVETVCEGHRPFPRWMRIVLWWAFASVSFWVWQYDPIVALMASGKYDLALTLIAALLVALSYWALRFFSREDLPRDIPMTLQDAVQELDRGGGWGPRVLSALDGAIPVKRASRHWLAQLFSRCLFSYQNLFWFTLIPLIHYGFAIPAWKRASIDHAIFMMVAVDVLTLLDPLLFRRLPVSALTLTSVTAGTALSTVGFFLLPTLVFQRIAGRFEVGFFFSNLFSMQTLGILWAKAGLVMGFWTLRFLLMERLSMSDSGKGRSGWGWVITVALITVADRLLGVFYDVFGWRSDVLVGSLLMFGSMALYYGMIRWGDRIYRSAGRTRGARAA